MRNQNQKKQQFNIMRQELASHQQNQRNNINEPYRLNFYRNPKQLAEQSPSQSSQTNKLSRTKSRLKQTRIKSKNVNSIYYELQSTKKNEVQSLRQENTELKKTIAELKLLQFYQFDQNKIKDILIQIDQLKSKLKKLQKQNQKLKLQNDFYSRSNMQMKSQLKRAKIREQSSHKNEDKLLNNAYFPEFNKSKKILTPRSSMQIPEYMLIGQNRLQNHVSIPESKEKASFTILDNDLTNNLSSGLQKQFSLMRMSSQKYINPRTTNTGRKKSSKKNTLTEVQNFQSSFK